MSGSKLTWKYNGAGKWWAASALLDENGESQRWRVTVTDQGSFSTKESDARHDGCVTPSLGSAKDYCEQIEAQLIAEQQAKAAGPLDEAIAIVNEVRDAMDRVAELIEQAKRE
jgi:phosphatidylserine/phosphatidylglycerophosphate/cardiolipin synthase-like enzyme